ncbi:MAG: ABC transporter ATP-binding protein [Micavibrio sp.]|nr:ABC transporter ATP-binding protein [Micavibrio sp.]
MSTDIPKIELTGVTKSFGHKQILRGIDFTVPKGKSLVIIGGSGTGKSVTLKCILGLLKPDEGSIKIDGEETIEYSNKQRDAMMGKFGMLFQGAALFDSLKVWENVAFGLIHGQGVSKKDAREIAVAKIKAVGLKPEVANLYPAELSGGMQKRVGLARAVAASPDIIFFDEPTTGLDPIMADVINNLIIDQVKELGATALSITHDMASVRKIADYVAMTHNGVIVWHGAVDELDHSNNPYVEQFIHGRADGPITRRVI